MAWVRIDDRLHSHPKVLRAWAHDPAAIGLHLLALSYSADYLTDGVIGPAFVLTQLPQKRRRDRAVAALVQSGLWERNGEGWIIHDYLDFNESRQQILDRRATDAARKNPRRFREESVRHP